MILKYDEPLSSCASNGVVQVEHGLTLACFQRLILKYDEPLSSCAFNGLNLPRPYSKELTVESETSLPLGKVTAVVTHVGAIPAGPYTTGQSTLQLNPSHFVEVVYRNHPTHPTHSAFVELKSGDYW